MPFNQNVCLSVTLATVVVASVFAGCVVFAGSASAGANNIRIVSDQPVSGSGNVTVAVNAKSDVTFQVEDAQGMQSAKRHVIDGGSRDKAAKEGVIRTTLNLSELFVHEPASGTAMLYAGDEFSIDAQTFATKRQFRTDAAAPKVEVSGGASVQQGETARIEYTITDVPQKVSSARMQFVAQGGGVVKSLDGFQSGTGRTAQVAIPSDMPPGEYNVTLTAVDEAGHRTTDTLVNGLAVANAPSPVSKLRIVTKQPIAGSGNITVSVAADERASFKIEDANGTISDTKTVADGGPADLEASAGTVRTTLNLSRLFERKPASGTGIVYTSGGTEFSVPGQTFDTKHQVALDSDRPTVNIVSGGTARQGQKVKVVYTVTDIPQKVSTLKVKTIGPDGLVYTVTDSLQAGTTVTAEFTVPAYAPPGEYDVKLVAVDEVGHRVTDRRNDSVTVKYGDTTDVGESSNGVTASEITIESAQPVKGSGALVVRTSVSDVGVNATFRVQDSSGAVSPAVTVTDGGPRDLAGRRAAVIETALDLGSLYDGAPASGTGVVYAAGGNTLDVSAQTYQTKREAVLDSDAPSVDVYDGVKTVAPGQQVKLGFSATDTPPKAHSVTMILVGPDGTTYRTFTGLQTGEGRTVQFVLPLDAPVGEYDVSVVVVDEVGHRTSITNHDGLVVEDNA